MYQTIKLSTPNLATQHQNFQTPSLEISCMYIICIYIISNNKNLQPRNQVGIFGLTQTAIDKNHQQVSAVDAVLGRLVKCLTGRQSQRMSADTALSVLKSAYDPAAASNIVKTHMMREAVPSALSAIDDHGEARPPNPQPYH